MQLLCAHFPCDSSAPWRARRALEGIAEIEPVHDDALLVASELITNAVIHSPRGADTEVELVAERVTDGVRIVVTDRPRGEPASAHGQDRHAAANVGLGLLIVKSVARRWGRERTGRQRLWAVVAA
jgi:anti-sigma regulatory factor (Ser/Thr protein kinase)